MLPIDAESGAGRIYARVVLGGYMLVEGIPLHKTGIAIDPKCPVKTSDVAALFREQSKYPVAAIYTNELMHGKHYLADRMKDAVAAGNRTIVLDCVTQEDLDLIADAAITSKMKILAVDPGVFTATLARKLITPSKSRQKSKILAVMGSVHPNARTQMEQLWLSQRTYNVMIATKELLESDERREAEIARVAAEILEYCDRNQISTVTGDGIYPENRIDFKPYMERFNCSMNDVTDIINRSLAEIAHRIFVAEPTFRALYTTGGDITVSVCERFGAAGLDLKDEVLPLAAYGTILGGPFEGTHLITKGGSISNMKKPLVAVTLGDPAGIGPEIVVKTVADKDLFEEANCIVIGDAGIVKQAIGVTGVDLKVNCVEDPADGDYSEGVLNLIDL